ncbi:MAG: peptidoglycan DD-metalloendopeptidase family protein [Alphaproteobacteria bacterium]
MPVVSFLRAALAVLLACGSAPGVVLAADSKNTATTLQHVEAALRQKQTAAALAARAATDAKQEMEKLQRQLRDAAAAEAKRQDAIDDLTIELETLLVETAAARADLAATGKMESRALGVMLRLAHTPPTLWWLNDGISLDQERRMLLLRAAIRGLDHRAILLREKLLKAEKLQVRLEAKQRKLADAKADLLAQKEQLNALIAARQKVAAQHTVQRGALLKEAERLAASAADLHALLDKMARKKGKNRLNRQGPPEMAQGDLVLPVSGRVKQEFGALDSYGVKSRGTTLMALPGSRIVGPWAGKVVFAGPFKGYGAILILQHAGDYHSLLAGFGRIDVRVGQTVTAGEPVGIMAAAKKGNWAELYFELRRDGDTVNPLSVSLVRKRRV